MKLKMFVTALIMTVSYPCFSQSVNTEKKSVSDLKQEVLNQKTEENKLNIGSTAASGKSPALALLFSLVLPGAGHYYLDRMDVGKYFLGIDAAGWLGLVSMNVYGNSVRDDARTFSSQHAGVQSEGKDDDYYSNVGNYNNVYDYNNEMLIQGQYAKLYNINSEYWSWDNVDNRNHYESQRKSSERIYNSRIIFGSVLVANRIVSGISAYLIAGKSGSKKSSLNIHPELLTKPDYSFDGVKVNLTKNF